MYDSGVVGLYPWTPLSAVDNETSGLRAYAVDYCERLTWHYDRDCGDELRRVGAVDLGRGAYAGRVDFWRSPRVEAFLGALALESRRSGVAWPDGAVRGHTRALQCNFNLSV